MDGSGGGLAGIDFTGFAATFKSLVAAGLSRACSLSTRKTHTLYVRPDLETGHLILTFPM
jgi:hypothetical protein